MYSVNSSNIITTSSDYINTGVIPDIITDVNTLRDNPNNSTEQVWLKLSCVENQEELSTKYADICVQHKQEKKWVLFINAEESSLEQLAKNHGVDVSKVLCVSFKGKNKINNMVSNRSAHLDIEQLKSVLSRGNCSAVILSNASFNIEEMAELDSSARIGETHCVLLKNNKTTEPLLKQRKSH